MRPVRFGGQTFEVWIAKGLRRLRRKAIDVSIKLEASVLSFGERTSARAVRNGMVWMIPCVLLPQVLSFVRAICNQFTGLSEVAAGLTTAIGGLMVVLPSLCLVVVATSLAAYLRLPRAAMVAACLSYVGLIASIRAHPRWGPTFDYFFALVIPIVCIPLIERLSRWPVCQLIRKNISASQLAESINLTVPILLTGLLVFSGAFSAEFVAAHLPSAQSFIPDATQSELGFLYVLVNSFLWFFGIHGYYFLMPLLDVVTAPSLGTPSLISSSFLGSFVFIGGSGATLSLALAMVIHEKQGARKMLALTALPLAVFNINEILLFGLPIIFNLRLLIPFVLAPAVNFAIAFTFSQLDFLTIVNEQVPFNAPVILNALTSTGGSLSGVALQVLNVAVDVLIYSVFIRERHAENKAPLVFRSHGLLVALQKEVVPDFFLADGVALDLESDQLRQRLAYDIKNRAFMDLAKSEIILEYQPSASVGTNSIESAEALIRIRDPDGRVRYPTEFIDLLAHTKLKVELDLWVLREVVSQLDRWRVHDAAPPVISVNVCRDTLCSQQAMQELLTMTRRAHSRIRFEITEQSFAGNLLEISRSIAEIRQAGAEVFIDDFGTGYSALSYFNDLAIDGIKIDRSFVLACADTKGISVLRGIIQIARDLNLNIVVEGVESVEVLNSLHLPGWVSVQGWVIAKSMAPELLCPFIAKWNTPDAS